MLPIPVNHGSRPEFLRALRDHLMRWDPLAKSAVDKVCREYFDLTFDQMLLWNPRFIAERTPHHIPSPNVLVVAIQHIYDMFKDAIDVKTGLPLFTEPVKIKAKLFLSSPTKVTFQTLMVCGVCQCTKKLVLTLMAFKSGSVSGGMGRGAPSWSLARGSRWEC